LEFKEAHFKLMVHFKFQVIKQEIKQRLLLASKIFR